MRSLINGTIAAIAVSLPFPLVQAEDVYQGKYCSGRGDVAYLTLIDQSFDFFHANPDVPNLTMLYEPDRDTFEEGAGWGAWWIQNSYGFSYAVTPFLREPWFSTLQRSWDLFWSNQGDGKRMGQWRGRGATDKLSVLVAPDGSLGDCAMPNRIVYKQGDGNVDIHDWFYEGTAAGVVMQAEILLASRDAKAIDFYLPKMERACDCVERTRDPKNNLFLVGPASDLLAPSYGGVLQPDGTFGKGYLAGLSVNYIAAVERMVELFKITGDQEQVAEYEHRLKITRESLPLLMTPAGYFVKSVETSGVKHGVPGQEKFGYLTGVVNADAMGLRVVDDANARSIYRTIRDNPAIRPFDFLMNNAPSLDDTYKNYGSTDFPATIFRFGDWVNGGCWGTVEGRAILGYYRVGAFEDIRRSAIRAMKWAKEFRMDEPWSQHGENTNNPWSDTGRNHVDGIAIMIDNFAIPAATIRGLFDYEYRSEGLILRPRVPETITEYTQKEPVRLGEKKLYISCRNGGMKVKSVIVNGRPVSVASPDAAVLTYANLPGTAKIEIVTEGGWNGESSPSSVPATPDAQTVAADPQMELPERWKKPYAVMNTMDTLLVNEPKVPEDERAFVREVIASMEAWRQRTAITPEGYFRPMTIEKRDSIVRFYERAAARMYKGFAKRMSNYAKTSDADKKRLATLFEQAIQ